MMGNLAHQIFDIAREIRGPDDEGRLMFNTLYDIGEQVATLTAERDAQEDALGSCREAFEGLEAENERLRAALTPFARIADLTGFPKGINVTLWERTTNVEGEDGIAITLADCIEAQRALEGSDPH